MIGTAFEIGLLEISKHIVLASFILWSLYVAIYRRLDSLSLTMTISIFALMAMHMLTPYLYKLALKDGLVFKAIWHFSFSCINILVILSVTKSHQALKLKIDPLTIAIGGCFFLATILQMIRFFEKAITETSLFAIIYSDGIQLINIMLTIVFAACIFRGRKVT